jgi:hypothetical protein
MTITRISGGHFQEPDISLLLGDLLTQTRQLVRSISRDLLPLLGCGRHNIGDTYALENIYVRPASARS